MGLRHTLRRPLCCADRRSGTRPGGVRVRARVRVRDRVGVRLRVRDRVGVRLRLRLKLRLRVALLALSPYLAPTVAAEPGLV